ncbi:hypothetical protein [Photobacterium phosphoreum]|nr:hypothetical protein [Photobacterium phosphoreum]
MNLKRWQVLLSHYTMNELRTWRLDVIAKALKKNGIVEFTVKLAE